MHFRRRLRHRPKTAAHPPVSDGRRDLRNETVFTVDGEDARDLDDAVSVTREENGWLLGCIADVSAFVRPGTAVDEEAYLRGTSVYFPDRVLPMLPKALSNGVCSSIRTATVLPFPCLCT